jgi:hypothetical protein
MFTLRQDYADKIGNPAGLFNRYHPSANRYKLTWKLDKNSIRAGYQQDRKE